jgi:hypothetical protein
VRTRTAEPVTHSPPKCGVWAWHFIYKSAHCAHEWLLFSTNKFWSVLSHIKCNNCKSNIFLQSKLQQYLFCFAFVKFINKRNIFKQNLSLNLKNLVYFLSLRNRCWQQYFPKTSQHLFFELYKARFFHIFDALMTSFSLSHPVLVFRLRLCIFCFSTLMLCAKSVHNNLL